VDAVEIKLFILILIANGSPIIVARLLGPRLAWPVDMGVRFAGNPLLGRSKTWRGIISAVLTTALAAWLLGVEIGLGLLIGATAMLGDLLASFTKRRMGIRSSDMAPGLDQIPESLLPLLALKPFTGLDAATILLLVLAFIFIELALSRIGYALKLRKRPY
jgi:CDP-2,3-bis-(O-geranylgeranyl)-sn-glycerol synthase